MSIYFEDFLKIYVDCLDMTFIVCDMEQIEFGPQMFLEILHQILPTAFSHFNALWPFHKVECVCKNFNIFCKHNPENTTHCLDIPDPSEHPNDRFQLSRGTIKPLKYVIHCMTTYNNLPEGFLLSARIYIDGSIRILPPPPKKGSHRMWKKIAEKKPVDFFRIDERYALVQQTKPFTKGYMLEPLPKLKEHTDKILSLVKGHALPKLAARNFVMEPWCSPPHTTCVSTTKMETNSKIHDLPFRNVNGEQSALVGYTSDNKTVFKYMSQHREF